MDPVLELALFGVEVQLIAALQVGQSREARYCQVLPTVGPVNLQTWDKWRGGMRFNLFSKLFYKRDT